MLSVRDPRDRGSSRSRERSRSRGGEAREEVPRTRDRSRDIRAPSPARAPSPPRSSRSGRTKQYYDPESDSEAITESESEDDRRSSRRRRDDKYDSKTSRRKESPPEDEYSDHDRRHERPVKSERDREYEARYQKPSSYNYASQNDYQQRMNYVKPAEDLAYGEHYGHQDHTRHMSMNTPGSFPIDDGRDRAPIYHDQPPMSPDADRPPYMMNVAGSRPQYQVPDQYKYAQPSAHLKYVPKNQGAQYVATHDAQIEVARSKSKRDDDARYEVSRQGYYDLKEKDKKKPRHRDSDVDRGKKYRDDSDDERRKKKYRDDSDDDKRKKKHKDTSDDEKRKKKYKDDSDHDRRSKKYRDDSDDDKKKKKKYRDDSDDDKRRSKYKDDSDDEKKKKKKKKKKYRDDSDDDGKKKSKRHSDDSDDGRRKSSKSKRETDEKHKSVKHDPRVVEIHPGGATLGTREMDSRLHRLSVSGHAPSTALTLMAPAAHGHSHVAGALPPGSPLLEAYHGTYQSISPMPSPMALPSSMDDGMSDLEPLDGDSDDDRMAITPRGILKKRVEIYDPEPDALAIAAELKHTKPGNDPLIQILPALSDDNIMALRTEYKKHFKVNGKGINIAKHIKLKVPGNVGKAAYATALGRWESEAYWSNFWYQSNTSRRELLIESLIGRPNIEIRKIKEVFSDKRYNDSLEKCMQAELKKDKFRHAVLLALSEKRQDELEKLSIPRIEADARDLYKALVAKDGGETAMIDIIVMRSDMHLRRVLQEFEKKFKTNFARQMIAKSQNLVTLAHILNGVLNRPVRDALLLHQAINETAKDRAELLVSRLVRAHWEPRHLERVKFEYKRKYGNRLEKDVLEATKGDFGEFCVALCAGAIR